jgi:hypothetical protein
MTFKADFDPPGHKTALTPTERLTVAYLHIVMGVDQHLLASMYRVNPGRIADAVKAARNAFIQDNGQ